MLECGNPAPLHVEVTVKTENCHMPDGLVLIGPASRNVGKARFPVSDNPVYQDLAQRQYGRTMRLTKVYDKISVLCNYRQRPLRAWHGAQLHGGEICPIYVQQ